MGGLSNFFGPRIMDQTGYLQLQLVKGSLFDSVVIDNDNSWVISKNVLLYLEHFCT
jgi:hypothetical protein